METKEEKIEFGNIQIQWFFVLIGALLAVVLGVMVNALYEFLREFFSRLYIFILFASIAVLLVDIFTYFFNNLVEALNPKDTEWQLLGRYFKYRLSTLLFWRKKS